MPTGEQGPERSGDTFLWARLERPPQGPRGSLNHPQIAKAAIELADRAGLAAVSMRRLAEALGVSTMALYRYVASKDEIFELMLDALAQVTLPEGPDVGWRDVMRSLAEQTRAAVLEHPWLIQLSAWQPQALTPNTLATTEKALDSIAGLGLDVDTMGGIIATVNAYVRGAASAEEAEQRFMRRRGLSTEDENRLTHGPRVEWLINSGRYPLISRYVLDGSNEDDAPWRFQFGLECVLDGIAARLHI